MSLLHIARQANPGHSPRSLWRTGDLFLRQMYWREALRSWHVNGEHALREAVRLRPSLMCVVKRPYINTEWPTPRKLAAIESHYQLMSQAASVLRSGVRDQVRLATVTAHDLSVDFVLDSPVWFEHEGELSLNLFNAGHRIYSLVFSLGIEGTETVAYVGAVQGLRADTSLALYRRLTHAMHGMRPRDLLLASFRMLCTAAQVDRILAVGDRCAPCRSPYFRNNSLVISSYDAVWAEHGGRLRSDGFFDLPLAVPRRSPATIPSRKRSEYKRRYEMLDGLDADLTARLRNVSPQRAALTA